MLVLVWIASSHPISHLLMISYIIQWDLTANEAVRTVENAHSLNVSAITYGNNSKTVFSGSRDYSVKGWDAESGINKTSFSCPRNIVTALTIGKSGEHSLYQGSEDLCVRVWDVRSNSSQPVIVINSFVYFPLSLALHPNEFNLVTGTVLHLLAFNFYSDDFMTF